MELLQLVLSITCRLGHLHDQSITSRIHVYSGLDEKPGGGVLYQQYYQRVSVLRQQQSQMTEIVHA